MLLSTKKSIDDYIIEILSLTPYLSGPDLLAAVALRRGHTAKQSVYTALESLISDEIVARVSNQYLITKVWLNRIDKLLSTHRESIFDLADGESISYHFPSLISCDTYWEHLFNLLIEWTPETTPIAIWNPHEWFGIAREPIERDIYASFARNNRYAFFTTRGTSPLDHEFKRAWRTDHVAINCDNDIALRDDRYINIFGDFIIEVIFATELTEKIADWYQSHAMVTPENIAELIAIVHEKHPIRMKITRSQKKSTTLRKRLLRDFYLPGHLIG